MMYLERYKYFLILLAIILKGESLLMEQVIKEKISADHLLYVSLKYTKTCDVIINLLYRWKVMLGLTIENLFEKVKKGKKSVVVSEAPRAKLIFLKKAYANEPVVIEALNLYELFRDIDTLEKIRENEFRKGVNLKVTYKGEVVNINLEKLKEYASVLERFISYIK